MSWQSLTLMKKPSQKKPGPRVERQFEWQILDISSCCGRYSIEAQAQEGQDEDGP